MRNVYLQKYVQYLSSARSTLHRYSVDQRPLGLASQGILSILEILFLWRYGRTKVYDKSGMDQRLFSTWRRQQSKLGQDLHRFISLKWIKAQRLSQKQNTIVLQRPGLLSLQRDSTIYLKDTDTSSIYNMEELLILFELGCSILSIRPHCYPHTLSNLHDSSKISSQPFKLVNMSTPQTRIHRVHA